MARILNMPCGEQRCSQVVDVAAGKVLSVAPFKGESQSMIFVEEIYLSTMDDAHAVSDINKELHRSGGALYAYSLGDEGLLSRLL